MAGQDWKPVSLIAEGKGVATAQRIAKNLSVSARVASGRTAAAGAAGVLDFGGPGGSSLPSVLATGSPLSTFQYTLGRADRLSLFRYFAKCFVDPKVPVTLADGSEKSLGEILPGDYVLNVLGKPTQVLENTQSYYEGSVLYLKTKDREEIGVTPEHPFLVLRKEKVVVRQETTSTEEIPEWLEAKDIKPGDYLLCLTSKVNYRDIPELPPEIHNTLLVEVLSSREESFKGQIYNLATCGINYDERTFLVSGLGTHNTDPFVGRALELHSELPMSRLTIGPPKGPSPKQNREINRIYESMSERLDLLTFLLEFAREYWLAGDVYVWHEWSDELMEWSDIYILPVEFCHSVLHPFNRKRELIFFARPLVDTAAIRRMTDRDLYLVADAEIERLYEALGNEVPEELKDALNYGEAVPLNTNWRRGSFVAHIPRNRPPNEEYGQSLIERCLETLLRLENLKNAQLQISSRNMNPKHIIYAEGIGEDQLLDLRNQVDLAFLENADYPIVTNYPVTWNTIGANDRLLAVGEEYATLREDLATGLGSTKEMLTGQASYGGQRITLEMMNTQYLTFRELVRKYTEEFLFRPVAYAKGHYFREEIPMWVRVEPEDIEVGDELIEEDSGDFRRKRIQVNIVWNHSSLRFNRLSIRDNAEVYDQLFQLHQKGSLAVRYLLDLHNIDVEENNLALLEDIGTPRDPVFNDLMRQIYTATQMAQSILDNTNLMDKVITGLDLKIKPQAPPPTSTGDAMGGPPMGSPAMGGMGGLDAMGGPPSLDGSQPEMGLNPELGEATNPGDPGLGVAQGNSAMNAPLEGINPGNAPTASRRATTPEIFLPGRVVSTKVSNNLLDKFNSMKKPSREAFSRLLRRSERVAAKRVKTIAKKK
jgi:intein/homing endonuclease